MSKDIQEGKVKKGGVNKKPTTPRPPPPKGEGGRAFIEQQCVDCPKVKAGRELLEALNKYGRHSVIGGPICEASKHSDYQCTCGLTQILAAAKAANL